MPTEWVIQPDTIRRKAMNRYKEFRRAWFQGRLAEFFPMEIHGKKNVSSKANYAELVKQMRLLREESSEHRSRGYRVEWKLVNSPRFGRNEFPERIFIDTCEDYLFLVEKRNEFCHLEMVVAKIRDSFPELDQCLSTQLSTLPQLADDIDSLLVLLQYFRDHPKPDCFLREIPAVGVHTKFIERQEIKNVLRQWLDIILPAWAIRSDEDHFEPRYFLRYDERLIRTRLLDPALQQKLYFPCSDLAIPLHSFENLDIQRVCVMIVENKITLLTLPLLQNTIAIGGMGDSVTLLKYVPWLKNLRVIYWGDLDSDGFRILSNLRTILPSAQSVLMDEATLDRFKPLLTEGNGRYTEVPSFLSKEEMAAFVRCRNENVRLEQERIPLSELNLIFRLCLASCELPLPHTVQALNKFT